MKGHHEPQRLRLITWHISMWGATFYCQNPLKISLLVKQQIKHAWKTQQQTSLSNLQIFVALVYAADDFVNYTLMQLLCWPWESESRDCERGLQCSLHDKDDWLVVASGRVRRLVFLRVFYDLYVSIVLFLNAHMYMMLRCWWVGWGGVGGWGMLTSLDLAHIRDATLMYVLLL